MPEQVTAPQAQPPGYSLLSVLGAPVSLAALKPDSPVGPNELPTTDRWPMVGVEFSPEACGVSTLTYQSDSCLGSWPNGAFDAQDLSRTDVTISPMFAVVVDKASAFCYQVRDWEGRVRRQLASTLSYQFARELWTGEQAVADSVDRKALTDHASTVVTSAPAGVIAGMACLDSGLAVHGKGRRGLIHVTPQLLSHLAAAYVITRNGTNWVTAMGNIVVADAGYTGDGPVDAGGDGSATIAGDSQWGYATSWMAYGLGDVILWPETRDLLFQQMNRSLNDVTLWGGQSGLILWDPCVHLAAEFDLAVCG